MCVVPSSCLQSRMSKQLGSKLTLRYWNWRVGIRQSTNSKWKHLFNPSCCYTTIHAREGEYYWFVGTFSNLQLPSLISHFGQPMRKQEQSFLMHRQQHMSMSVIGVAHVNPHGSLIWIQRSSQLCSLLSVETLVDKLWDVVQHLFNMRLYGVCSLILTQAHINQII